MRNNSLTSEAMGEMGMRDGVPGVVAIFSGIADWLDF